MGHNNRTSDGLRAQLSGKASKINRHEKVLDAGFAWNEV